MKWEPPILHVRVRYEGDVFDHTAEWRVNLTAETATHVAQERRLREVPRRQPPFDVRPLAAELAQSIAGGQRDQRLQWSKQGRVRIRPKLALPVAGTWTTRDRRERLYRAVLEHLSVDGWEHRSFGWLEPPRARIPVAARIAKLGRRLARKIIHEEHDPRVYWVGQDRTVVRLQLEVSPGKRHAEIPPSWRQDVLGHVEVYLHSHGWYRDERGWFVKGEYDGQIGWVYSDWQDEDWAVCLWCVERVERVPRWLAKPLYVEDVRPHPQHCTICKARMAGGVIDGLPDRYADGPSERWEE